MTPLPKRGYHLPPNLPHHLLLPRPLPNRHLKLNLPHQLHLLSHAIHQRPRRVDDTFRCRHGTLAWLVGRCCVLFVGRRQGDGDGDGDGGVAQISQTREQAVEGAAEGAEREFGGVAEGFEAGGCTRVGFLVGDGVVVVVVDVLDDGVSRGCRWRSVYTTVCATDAVPRHPHAFHPVGPRGKVLLQTSVRA